MLHQRKRRVLVVEDDDSYRRLVTRILELAGFEITAVSDSGAAMNLIEDPTPFDLLLADIGMPSGTPHGLSVGTMAKSRCPDLKVLYMTGGQDAANFALYLPGIHVLRKPFRPDELLDAARAALA